MTDVVGSRRGEPVGPPLNRLVARRHDLDAAQQVLSGSRLLTFTGHGGVGKTRLANPKGGLASALQSPFAPALNSRFNWSSRLLMRIAL